jgi:hypothetical protein
LLVAQRIRDGSSSHEHQERIMICACTSLILAAAFAQAVPGPRITIFVGPQGRDGIHNVDSGIADSITDIKNELRRSGLFTLASNPDGAVLSLVVVGVTRRAVIPSCG